MTTQTLIDRQNQATAQQAIIDANMHWLPETLFSDHKLLRKFLDTPPRAYGIEASLRPIADTGLHEIVIEQPRGHAVLNYAEGNYSLASQLEDMDRANVAIAVLRLPCWQEWLDLEGCQLINDGLAQHMARAPGRFRALAAVPPWGSEDMIREADRRLSSEGFVGVQLAAHYGNLYLDDPAFRPFLRWLNDHRVPVVVHHTPLPVDYGSILDFTNLRRQMGRCMAQATAVGRELFSGLFDELPDLRLCHSMLGGGFFAFVDMLFPPHLAAFPDEVDRFAIEAERLRAKLASNVLFDLSGAPQWGAAQLECAIKVLGHGNILYGGSYPIRRDWFFLGAGTIESLNVDAEARSAVLQGNARRFFRL